MKKAILVFSLLVQVCYAQVNKDSLKAGARTFANSFFDDNKKSRTTAAQKVEDIFPSFTDDFTGEQISFSKVSKWADGSAMSDTKVDGIIYRKKGNEYYRRNFRILTPEMFGAIGDGKTDDLDAFKRLFSFARSQNNATIEAASGKTYKLTNSVVLDYTKQGVVDSKIHFNGNGCKMFLTEGNAGTGWWAFNIATDKTDIQNTKFNFNNITFTCDNIRRPSGIKVTGACFVTIENCKFENLGEGIRLDFAGMARVNNCWAWGCIVGFVTYRSKDTYINECHAYGCDWGYRLEGINNTGSDGNVSLTNSVANGCKQYNLKVKGIYGAFINNCVFEMSPINISIESSNFGKISNIFSGPGRVEFIKNTAMVSNDYWNISNMDCQGLVTITSLKFSNITNFKVSFVSNTNNPESTSIFFADCYKNNVTALTVEGTKDNVKNGIVVSPDCSIFTWSNLILDRSILLKGKDRGGVHVLSSSIISGGVVAEDGAFKKTESFDYLALQNGTRQSIRNGVKE